MRVLFVIDNLGSGGAQRQMVSAAVGLAVRGHEVECFTYYPDAHFAPDLQAAGVRVHLHLKRGRFSVGPVLALARLARQGRFNALVAFEETPSVYAELAGLLAPSLRVIVAESNIVYDGSVSVGRWARSQLHRRAAAIVSNSHTHSAWLGLRFPFLRESVRTVWNGVDTQRFRPGPERPERTELHLLGVGRIAPAKNIPRLAEAFADVLERGVAARLSWVGRVDDPGEDDRARRRVSELGLAARWEWLGERSDVPELLRSADALIAPSLWEGLPNVVCEALASGLPVLASRASDNARLVPDGVHGLNFEAEDTDAIRDAIVAFSSLSQSERRSMGERGRQFAVDRLSLSAFVDSYERVTAGYGPR